MNFGEFPFPDVGGIEKREPTKEAPASEAAQSLARLLRPFVVTFYVYTSNQKPEDEEWKFPNNRTYANDQGKYLYVVREKNASIAMC